MILGVADEFSFGKYEGQRIQEVLESDPDYIRWCVENLENVCFTPEVEEFL